MTRCAKDGPRASVPFSGARSVYTIHNPADQRVAERFAATGLPSRYFAPDYYN